MPYQATISRIGAANVATVAVTNGVEAITATIYYDANEISRGYLIQFSRPVNTDGRISIAYEYFSGHFSAAQIAELRHMQRAPWLTSVFTEAMIVSAIKAPRNYKDPYYANHIAMSERTGDLFGKL